MVGVVMGAIVDIVWVLVVLGSRGLGLGMWLVGGVGGDL